MSNSENALIFATSYVKTVNDWFLRYEPWINYYSNSPLAHIPLLLIDDGSPYLPELGGINIAERVDELDFERYGVNIFSFPDNLGRTGLVEYPGWWRSFIYSAHIAKVKGFSKLIHIESDAYILSGRMFDFINNFSIGWFVPWLKKYKMPETAIQIIGQDQMKVLENFSSNAYLNVKMAEKILPFTDIQKNWVGDRYSEFKKNRWIFKSRRFDRFGLFQKNFFFESIPAEADFATQVVPRQFSDIRFQNVFTSRLTRLK